MYNFVLDSISNMSNVEAEENGKPFCIDRAKQSRATCKKCKQKCPQGELRIAKLMSNPFGTGKMKSWHHVSCIFEQFVKQKITTKRIESAEDIDGWDLLSSEDKKEIIGKIEECNNNLEAKYGVKIFPKKIDVAQSEPSSSASSNNVIFDGKSSIHRDCYFREFRRLVAAISNVSSYLDKTKLVHDMFTKGSDGGGFKDDVTLWCKLLLPGVIKRIYNLHNKQLIKLFSRIFGTDHTSMLKHLEQGDIGETIQCFFEQSKKVKPANKSILTVIEVEKFLKELSKLTREEEQIDHFHTIISRCTGNDLKVIIRLIRHDLRMNAGPKHILQGIHSDAYEMYQSSRDLEVVVNKCLGSKSSDKTVKANVTIMTPCLPMLAEPCKSIEQAMIKCPNGMYSEIKYDGERVQVHKMGSEFKYFSRSLKPVLPHKVAHFENYIPKAFPHGKDLILDSEILMIDTNTGKPLPFGTLGVHKKNKFKDATVCLFVFDCIYFNGETLTDKPLKDRKQILKDNMTEIPNHIVFSEMQVIHDPEDLKQMIARVLKEGLEGLVLKDTYSLYEPGKRHWLKVKKDYLFEGAMADSADLIVLGAWYGSGKKGGMMSVFLMGCYDPYTQKFYTVTKVHTGHDDETLDRLQSELDMVKISCDAAKVPKWLDCNKTMIPDFVASDPKKQPVWEISGAEFTRHEVHTADGISIRFPRITKIRDDKTWDTATNLQELQSLFKKSKECTDINLLLKNSPNRKKKGTEDNDCSLPSKKLKQTSLDQEPKHTKQNTILSLTPRNNVHKPSLSTSPKANKRKLVAIENTLPDYFTGIKVLLEKGVKSKHHRWLRYFVAFGGKILDPENWRDTTHMLHLKDFTAEMLPADLNVKHVTADWIKDSVLKAEVQTENFYSVYLEPKYNYCVPVHETCETLF